MEHVIVTDQALNDLAELPTSVESTFLSAVDTADKNLELGAEPRQAIGKYLAGNMHPILQMALGRDYRAWFIEGNYIPQLDDSTVYAFMVTTKKEAKRLTGRIRDSLAFVESVLG
jgi:hypothetical protein